MASVFARCLADKLDSIAVQIETLDPETPPAPDAPTVQTSMASVDERQQVLAEHAKLKLPLPLQTLLGALLDVKQDIERDLVRQELNADSAILAACASEVSFVASEIDRCRGLFETNSPVQQLKKLPDVERLMERIQARYARLLAHGAARSPLEAPLPALQTILRETQRAHLRAKQTLFEGRSVPLSRPEAPVTGSLQSASKAIAESSSMRNRLAALATGELRDLIEPSTGAQAPVAPLEEPPLVAAQQAPARASETDELEAFLADIHDAIRTVRRALVGLQADQRTIVQTSVEAVCGTLRQSGTRLRNAADEQHHAVASTVLTRADKALQAEIALLLKTISADRPALDSVLKSIKAKCLVMRQSSVAQAARDAELQYGRWMLQLDAVARECIGAALEAK